MGTPARVVRNLDENDVHKIQGITQEYLELMDVYAEMQSRKMSMEFDLKISLPTPNGFTFIMNYGPVFPLLCPVNGSETRASKPNLSLLA